MRRDRRAALLIGVPAALAVGASAIVVPTMADGILPAPGDLAVGWVLLIGAVAVARLRYSAALLGVSAVLWVLAGLAPYLGPLTEAAERASMLPTALLVVTVVAMPHQLPTTRVLRGCATVSVGAAVIGGLGHPRGMVLVMGLATLVAQSGARHSNARLAGLGTGLGFTLIGLWGSGYGDIDPATLANLHDLTMIVGTIGAVTVLLGLAQAARRDGTGDATVDLGRVLGGLLGQRHLVVVFADGDRWLDPAGRTVDRPAGGGQLSVDGIVTAWWQPAPVVDPVLRPTVDRLLVAARRGALLRAELEANAAEIAASRDRLAGASADARRRVADQLRAGPLARLRRARDLVALSAPDLVGRFDAAEHLMDEMVSGLDPVTRSGGLRAALTRLCDDAGAALDYDCIEPLSAEVARAVWFTCSEGLANAAKHAPGANVRVRLSEGPCLEVVDDGPGGADADGGGLSGLRARAAGAGAVLTIDSGSCGTTLRMRADTRRHVPGDVVAPMSAASAATTVDA